MKNAILILGMHRSGTSALARVLNLLGVDLNRDLMAKEPDNERGYWESRGVADLHDQLLLALGSSWDETIPLPDGWWRRHEAAPVREALLALLRRDFAASPLWLVKDPRLCRLLPLWLDVLRELRAQPHCVVITRNPAEVVDSLRLRSGISPGLGYPLWLDHVLAAERSSRGLPRVFVSYEQLLDGWRETADEIGKQLGLTWPRALPDAAAEIDEFLSPDLRHHRLAADVLDDEELSPWIGEAHRVFEDLAAQGEGPRALAALDGIGAQLAGAERLYGRSLSSLRGERALLRIRISELEATELRLGQAIDDLQARLELAVSTGGRQLELKDEQIARSKETFAHALSVKGQEVAHAQHTMSETVLRKDEQIAGISEYLEMRTQELDRTRVELAAQGQLAEQLRAELRTLGEERDRARADAERLRQELVQASLDR